MTRRFGGDRAKRTESVEDLTHVNCQTPDGHSHGDLVTRVKSARNLLNLIRATVPAVVRAQLSAPRVRLSAPIRLVTRVSPRQVESDPLWALSTRASVVALELRKQSGLGKVHSSRRSVPYPSLGFSGSSASYSDGAAAHRGHGEGTAGHRDSAGIVHRDLKPATWAVAGQGRESPVSLSLIGAVESPEPAERLAPFQAPFRGGRWAFGVVSGS
jgi:hypothetical protein